MTGVKVFVDHTVTKRRWRCPIRVGRLHLPGAGGQWCDVKQHKCGSLISPELELACATEPIHLLGTVQPHGFLMTVDADSGHIVQVSSGIVRHWHGLSDHGMLIGATLTDWVDGIDESRGQGIVTLQGGYPTVMPWRARFERTGLDHAKALAAAAEWECLAHRCGAHVVLEWSPVRSNGNDAFRQQSIFDDITHAVSRLRNADRLLPFFGECAEAVQHFSGFDRVMIYRFLPDGCGEVVAERTSPRCAPRFLGLRFPASDIPSQARALYLSNRLRVLADVEATTDRLTPPSLPDGSLLDQSHCMLRGLSPVHLSYLHNMGVRATLTLSIVCSGRLWGLIACHHDQPRSPPHHVREGMRQLCELVGEVANMRIEALLELEAVRQRLMHDHLQNLFQQSLLAGHSIGTVLQTHLGDVLQAFDASGFGARIGKVDFLGGSCRCSGTTRHALDDVASRLDAGSFSPVEQMWDDLLTVPGRGLAGLPDAAGLLLAQRREEETAFCFLVRQEVVQKVRWGGAPEKDLLKREDGMVLLEPRRSFAEWQQTVQGRAESWEAVAANGLKHLLQILSEAHKVEVNHALHKKLEWRALHDQLTGLYNRRAMEDEVTLRLNSGRFDAALLLLDLDNFKQINDTYGHAVGDQVLQQLSGRLRKVTREFDLLARQGGDEFLLLMHLLHPDPARALILAERVHRAVDEAFDINGQQLQVGMSIGIAIPPEHGRTVGELLRRADLALYQAKSMGRARSVVFERMLESDQLDLYLLERDLDDALLHHQLSLVFQPKVDLATCRVTGLEALVRWHHPTRGENLPGTFIPIAERGGQIVQIDRWVMRTALEAQAAWQLQGQARVPVAVNLSMADILSSDLLGYVSDLMAEHKLPPTALEVELTESCVMRELEQTRSVLLALNDFGISTTLDDFGTGFSSLSHLRHLPLQCLKIDQSFIAGMLGDLNVEKLTQAILAMGMALEMQIVAEGIETQEQMDWLLNHGCHVGQGFFFSPGVVAKDVYPTIERIERRLREARQGSV